MWYAVRTCAPPVPEMQALLDRLNDDKDFSGFVRSMRRAFQSVA